MYDIRDVIDKYKRITEQRIAIFESMVADEGDIRNRMLINVFIKSARKEIEHCHQMRASISDAMASALDFDVYDKISFLVNQFSRTLVRANLRERRQLVDYALLQEKAVLALLLDIQGRMLSQEGMEEKVAYYVLTELIELKKRFIQQMEKI